MQRMRQNYATDLWRIDGPNRRAVYRGDPNQRLRFSGKLQGGLEMTTAQLDRFPDIYLFAKRNWRLSRRFIPRCHPRGTKWIVASSNQGVTQVQPAGK